MRATGIGSMPGTDLPQTLRMILGMPLLPWLPELPARGVWAGIIGRTAAMLDGLAVDLQPAGWRLTDAAGGDQTRARSLLRHDLDELEEALAGLVEADPAAAPVVRITMAGPWTMAACVERPRGDRVLADHGARRELADSLGQGASGLLAELRRRMPDVTFSCQLDEPMLPAVMNGGVPTASGFSKHRQVDLPVACELLARLVEPLRAQVDEVGLHCCAAGLDLELPARVGLDSLALDLSRLVPADWDHLGPWLEGGRRLVLGVADSAAPDQLPGVDALVTRILRVARSLGVDPEVWARQVDLAPACGLAGWTSVPAGRLLEQLVRAAELATEELAR